MIAKSVDMVKLVQIRKLRFQFVSAQRSVAQNFEFELAD